MVDIGALIALSKEAISGGIKLHRKYKNKKLSPIEKELLVAGAKHGEFHILSVDQISGYWVRVNGKDFMDESDPAFAAKYFDGVRSLIERGYVIHKDGIQFVLSGSGFDKARELANKK